jgi:nucleotide-binding universal stress UspA family protein
MVDIIVPLDGSRGAEVALPHARALAGDGTLHVLTSIWKGEPPAPRRYHEDRALRLAGEPAEGHIGVEEPPSAAIARFAGQFPDALVCMASHGRNALSQAVLGSTAEAYLRDAVGPTVLVGPHANFAPARWEAANLIVAVDDEETAAVLAPVASGLVDRYGVRLWVVQAVAPAPYPFAVGTAEDLAGEATGADELVRLLAVSHRSVETKVVVATDPANAVVQFAEDLPASLVLMTTHARRGIARLALGSVAMRVVHRAPCPVVVVRQ